MTERASPELLEQVAEATSAFIRGDMRRYFALVDHTDDFTLMPPEGGPTHHGFQVTEDVIAEMERFFKGGEAVLEVEQTYASGDLAVIVAVERQHGEVGDHPRQDLSLRVTLVFCREGTDWRLVHRHADALVHPITFDHLTELARGEARAVSPVRPGRPADAGRPTGRPSRAGSPPG